jgi:aspartate kinase
LLADTHLAKVSIVGTGINIELITTSEIRVTCLIEESRVPAGVRAPHKAFALEEV